MVSGLVEREEVEMMNDFYPFYLNFILFSQFIFGVFNLSFFLLGLFLNTCNQMVDAGFLVTPNCLFCSHNRFISRKKKERSRER